VTTNAVAPPVVVARLLGSDEVRCSVRYLPAGDRPGRAAWWGPISLALALSSWLFPVGGAVIAVVAVVCGVLSMATDREYRLDWTAVAGTPIGAAQLVLSLLLLLLDVTDR
jgi:hypothetical protein